ncbi:phosphopantothenoylcysteine decarboxylase [Streptococcus sp. DD12]|uniref:phosphopantothenoylcysteine decarboxylase n=1 Tax=Streptococcus sp. DD12 TaxID=1777880 RepID=UPI0007919651|nr:phosphopantothenoylcysteine decarboxylase [Streptococcus sp. DD12]KXT76523.1 Phosphopantothenoylcysteine decarboxylase / Phosphopantothenoylcysteine synthetase [Streptococcus sp. DD12]
MANILLAVSGSISAYKAADLTSQLRKRGHAVQVIMTKGAQAFITPLTLQTLSKRPVLTDVMVEENPTEIAHIDTGKWADLFILAPASANSLAKLAHGFADDMLSATALALDPKTPKLIAPAMNTKMYQNPATQANLATLEAYGYHQIFPKESLLACGDYGPGALADLSVILLEIEETLSNEN